MKKATGKRRRVDTAHLMRSKGGRARADKLTQERRSEIGRMGGKARAAKQDEETRRNSARKAVLARWKKAKKGGKK